MLKQVSIAEARDHFAALVRDVEEDAPIEVTRHGKPVAVIISIDEYRRLQAGKTSFWEAYTTFRNQVDLEQLDIQPEVFAEVRDPSPGREVSL